MRASGLAIATLLLLAPGVSAETSGVQVVFVRDGVFTSPADPAWSRIPEVKIALQAQIIAPPNGGGGVAGVSVRAVHDGEELAFRLEWADASADRGVGVDTFRDAAALGFPVGQAKRVPSPFMGDPEEPVVIWQWAADFDANAEGKSRFGERYPHSEGVWIFPQDLGVRRQVRGWRGADPVTEFVANGFGTLAPRPNGAVSGTSRYEDGRWSVVLRRDLEPDEARDASFVPGQQTLLIAAIWDGSKDEVNGRKSITLGWVQVMLDGVDSSTAKADVGVSDAP